MDAGAKRLASEVERRRTFAIISHPDAGKTTLTEKLLLFGGAVREAGAVRAQRAARYATSDWLELEKQRGISVSSSVMHFDWTKGDDPTPERAGSLPTRYRVNILDTPGHRDFSEDTYRTLLAADSAVMLIDAAKGVEAQTRKLFEVCRLRHIPIFTFVNKLDRHGREPLELMAEIEEVLRIEAVPLDWPIGAGGEFRGVYDRLGRRSLYFSGGKHGTVVVEQREVEGPPEQAEVRDALELLDGAGAKFSPVEVGAGRQTPMFFGSALTNYGVLPFLERFLELAPPPRARETAAGPVEPASAEFSGFVFKIQANMDPDHRDRVAFLRVCSGRFVRGEEAVLARTQKPLRLAHSTLLMGQGREEVDEAFPGDVVGLFDPGVFRIGDTLSASGRIEYAGVPTFSPEHFRRVEVAKVERRKALAKGLDQLAQEGAVQIFTDPGSGTAAQILGVVGPLQFDVLVHRMASEYGVELRLTPLPYKIARWVHGEYDPDVLRYSETMRLVEDRDHHAVLLAESLWHVDRALARHPEIRLSETSDPQLS
ncbi:MAG TPA: peptide chain release factor 3 [Myxococcota bacterium]|nr:peptide chain release factor 3 [Myxococcota bacterium]